MKAITAVDIRALIESQIEPEEPQTTMVEYLGSHAGERLTKRHTDALMNMLPNSNIWIRKQYGMTHIDWGNGVGSKNGGSLLICWREKNVLIPTKEELIERNSCYFQGAQIRNNRRKVVLEKDSSRLAYLATVINDYNRVREELFQELLSYGKPFDADQHAIREAFVEGESK